MQSKLFARLSLLFISLIAFAGCDSGSETPPEFENPGFQKGEDWYEAADYVWTDIQSGTQLQGQWSGTKILAKDSVARVNPAYELAVSIKLTVAHTLYVLEEEHWFVDAVNKLDKTNGNIDRDSTQIDLRDNLRLSPTGSALFPTYPNDIMLIGDDPDLAWFSTIEMCLFRKEQWTLADEMLPSWVSDYSMKISEDGTKLLFQYADDIPFVVGKTVH